MVKIIVPKQVKEIKKGGVYKLTFEVSMNGPNSGGSGTFWADLDFDQIYNTDQEDQKPASDTEEAVAAFLNDWIEWSDLREALDDLEVFEMYPVSLTVERKP